MATSKSAVGVDFGRTEEPAGSMITEECLRCRRSLTIRFLSFVTTLNLIRTCGNRSGGRNSNTQSPRTKPISRARVSPNEADFEGAGFPERSRFRGRGVPRTKPISPLRKVVQLL